MRWNDIDFQIFLEISHVLSNIRDRRSTTQATASKCAGRDRCRYRRLEVCRRVSLPYFTRSVLMESMHKLVELKRIDFATIPAIELRPKLSQSELPAWVCPVTPALDGEPTITALTSQS